MDYTYVYKIIYTDDSYGATPTILDINQDPNLYVGQRVILNNREYNVTEETTHITTRDAVFIRSYHLSPARG